VPIIYDAVIKAQWCVENLIRHWGGNRCRATARPLQAHDRCAPRGMMTPCIIFLQRDLVINFAQTRLGTLRYIFAITDSGPESGAGGRETGCAPA